MVTSLNPVLLNVVYAITGGALTLAFMWLGWRLFNFLTPFNVNEELRRGNTAVGMMVLGLLVGIGVSMGLVIGLSMN